MTAALKFLSRLTNDLFEAQMQRAARRISESQNLFPRHA
jgi:hypothetical protein